VASPEAAVGEPPPAALNGAATTFAPAAAPGVVIAAADVSDTALAPASVPTPEGAVAAATDEATSMTAIAASIVTDALKAGEEPPACVADMKGGARRVMIGVKNWMLDQEEDGEAHTLDCRVLGALTRAPYTTCDNVA